ncbi:MAG: glycosyltransferase family 9 protein [Chloroflexi bacterium]|nr:glycosyltransferase family 9 protein [Chloroflexota bacterium]
MSGDTGAHADARPGPTLLIMRAGAIGDFILTLPALSALRRRFAAHRIVLAARADMLPFAHGTLADEAIAFDSPRLTPLFTPGGDLAPLADWLGELDLVVAWLPESSAQMVSAAARALGAARWLNAAPKPTYGHAADYFVESLAPIGIVQPDRTPHLELTAGMIARGTDAWQASGFDGQRVVAIHVGSGGAAKCWPLERYVQLAADAAAGGLRVLILSGPAEESLAIPALPGVERLHFPDLPLLAALLARCAAYVGNDSGITHLAAAVGAPTLALFGPTDPAIWSPRGPRVTVLRSPTGRMDDLPYTEVRDALRTTVHLMGLVDL